MLLQGFCVTASPMAARTKRPELPSDMLAMTESLTVPALNTLEISRLESLLNSDPDKFQSAAAQLFKRLAVEGFRRIEAPKNYKELSTVIDLWRKLEGLDSKDKGGAIPAGLVRVVGGISRRVVDAVPVDDEPEFE